MKTRLYILTPNGNDFSESQMAVLNGAFDEVVFIDRVMPFDQLPDIMDENDKVFAIDPDFCDWNIPNSALDLPGLRAVCMDTTSFSWIDLNYARSKNVIVTNVRHWSSASVAEQAILLTFNVMRKIPLVLANNKAIDFATMRGTELAGKVAGIIGLGYIGTKIGELCSGLGMKVKYWSRQSTDGRFERVELADLFKTADVIFPALAKNPETEKIITDQLLESMKPTATFIDIVGESMYNRKLLLDMAGSKRIYGLGLEEQNPKNYAGNVMVVPPLAYYTVEAMDRNIAQWLECIVGIQSKEVKNKLN